MTDTLSIPYAYPMDTRFFTLDTVCIYLRPKTQDQDLRREPFGVVTAEMPHGLMRKETVLSLLAKLTGVSVAETSRRQPTSFANRSQLMEPVLCSKSAALCSKSTKPPPQSSATLKNRGMTNG